MDSCIDSAGPLEYGLKPLSSNRRGYYVYITEACNLRCNYCFVKDKLNQRHLTRPMADKVLAFIKDDAAHLKDTYIHFFGGEPLIRPAMVEYLGSELGQWSRDKGIKLKLGVTTNGTLLTAANCEMLKRLGIGVQLSLDGSKQGNDVHRQVMGGTQVGRAAAGAFELVQVQNYIKYFGGSRPNCRMTVTIHNLKYLSQSVRELHALGFRSFSVIPDADCGAWTEEHLPEYEREVDRLFQYWRDHRDVSINTIDQTIEKLKRKKVQTHLCQVGKTLFGITVDGDIYPCHDFSGRFATVPEEREKLLIGNVEKGFTKNQFEFENLTVDGRVKSGAGHDCATCWAKWVCSRACPYMNYAHSGDIRTVNATYCATTRINATLALRWMSVLGDFTFLNAGDLQAAKNQAGRALMSAMGGADGAPFGRNKAGKPLLPGPAQLRRFGLDMGASRAGNGVVRQDGVAGPPVRELPANN